jgi:putative (di)nucleoside polyphosphate hydrolase
MTHATGTSHWDLPKGGPDDGESPLAAALRETQEETGLSLDGAALTDLGLFTYRSDKALHLFGARLAADSFDLRSCRCNSYFNHHRTNKSTPEVDAFQWIPFSETPTRCAKNMTRVLTQGLSLLSLLESLPDCDVSVSTSKR